MPNRLIIEDLSDGRIQVLLRRAAQEYEEPAGRPADFASPFTEKDREDLRWYLEDYLTHPYAVYEENGKAIEAKLPQWGQALFARSFGASQDIHAAYIKAREGECELVIRSASPGFLGLPWELLHDPERKSPLAFDFKAFDRTLKAAGATAEPPPGTELRVLMVIARPDGPRDVGYQMVARPLLRCLDAVRGKVHLDVLRPPTFDSMRDKLTRAAEAGCPYHMLHFDGHGTFGAFNPGNLGSGLRYDTGIRESGYLVFEKEGGGDDLILARDFAQAVKLGRVPLVVLNACRSATQGELMVEAAVATRLLEDGAASVVAMAYSVYAVAAAEFVAGFYECLFAGKTVSDSVAAGRRQLALNRKRPSPKGMLPLEDWIVPVHYQRRAISFPALQLPPAKPGFPSFADRLKRLREAGQETGKPAADSLVPDREFVGRDKAFYELETALTWRRVAVVYGPAGMGKTELAKAFGRWWQLSGGVDDPRLVVFFSFEPGLASFCLDGAISDAGRTIDGPEFVGQTRDAAERESLLLDLMREHRVLLIWDNFESVKEMPDPSGATPALTDSEQTRLRDFLAAAERETKGCVLITSRTPETWLGEVRRIELAGLTPDEAMEMAENVLKPIPDAREKRQGKDFAELMDWIGGHPLTLRLVLPHLEKHAAANLLAAVKGETASLPPGFTGENRTKSLGASLQYSLAHLTDEQQKLCFALALFEGVADEDVLGLFSAEDCVPDRFAGINKEAWSALLKRLVSLGVLSEIGYGMYRMHPALPAYLIAAWRQTSGATYQMERDSGDIAMLQAYAGFGSWLHRQIQQGEAGFAFAAIDLHRRSMGRLLRIALNKRRSALAQQIMQPLNDLWNARGLYEEARSWADRCREALEDAQGDAPDFNSEDGALWLFAISSEANRTAGRHDLDAARHAYDTIRIQLESQSLTDTRQSRLSVVYHQLGMVAQDRGDLAAAETWYQKSLDIKKALGDRPGMASSYHELGVVAQVRGDLAAAESWYRKSLHIKEAQGDRPGMASSYHQLGVVAQDRGDLAAAESWYRKSLDINVALGDRPGMASSYHQLGVVAQDRGDLAEAESWYRKSLDINVALGNRPGMASSYHQLGLVAQNRGDLAAAENWYRKSLDIEEALGNRPGLVLSYVQLGLLEEARGDQHGALNWTVRAATLFEEFPHPATGPARYHLARLTAALGWPALEDSWARVTGAKLPGHVRTIVAQRIEDL